MGNMNIQAFIKAKKKFDQLIEKQNKAFNRSSRNKRRRAIIEDALMEIRKGDYIATSGTYVQLFSKEKGKELEYVDPLVQNTLLTENVRCDVCAKGSLLMSRARLGNDVEAYSSDLGELNSDSACLAGLQREFTEKELDDFERLFEGTLDKVLEEPWPVVNAMNDMGYTSTDRLLFAYQYFLRNNKFPSLQLDTVPPRSRLPRMLTRKKH